jgi:signal transduction histidine kinase
LLLIETQAANKAKSEFLATMSHELRTPLNAICGFSEIIEGEMFGPVGCPQYADYAKDIRTSGNHLLSIINDILDIAKAEAGKLVLNEEAFDLAETVESTVRMVTGTAEQKGLQILTGGVETAVMVCADKRLLSQALLNLLSNAIKFTEARGRVKVSLVTHDTGDVSIEIVDTGVGIAPADMDRIMRPFEQVESAMSRQNGGTGLGLPYSQKISEIHGGRLTLESALGLGTRCRIIIPEWRHINSVQALGLRKAS